MQEDEQNADWTDETNHEEEDGEQLTAHRAPIRKLITHYLLRYIPTQEQTGDNRSKRHQQLRREIVTIRKEILTEESQSWNCSLRKRTEYGNDAAGNGLYPRTLGTGNLAFLINHRRTNLVHGNRRGQSCQYQQGIEQYRDDVTHHRHIAKCLLEHIRQGNEDE